MSTSLYARGPATIEVGRYGLGLEDAKCAFIETCKECGLSIAKLENKNNKIFITIEHIKRNGEECKMLDKELYELLNKVADIVDLHSDPPFRYYLEETSVKNGEYVKTGKYND